MISNDRLTKALTYLAETDESCAKAKAYMLGIDKQEKTVLGLNFLSCKGEGSVAERDARARTMANYLEWRQTYENAVADYEILKNKRDTEALVVEVWRSLNANRRHGNI